MGRETDNVDDLVGPLLVSLLSGDDAGVEEDLRTAVARGLDTATIARDLIEPTLTEIGEMWHRGDISEAEEHLATATISRALSCLPAPGPPPLGAPRIVFSCLNGEFHELGVRIATSVAREAGWASKNLGANLPRAALVKFIAQRRPEAIGLSIALSSHIPESLTVIDELHQVDSRLKILVGGSAFRRDPLFQKLPVAAECIPDTVALRDWLVGHRRPRGRRAPPNALPRLMPASLRRRIDQQARPTKP